MGNRRQPASSIIIGAIVLVGFAAAVEIAVMLRLVSEFAVPRPTKIGLRTVDLLTEAAFIGNWRVTLGTWLASFVIGVSFGLTLGILAGANNRIGRVLRPPFGYFRAIPPIALFPVALVALGPGNIAIGSVAAAGAALYVFPGTAEAAREAVERFSRLAQVLGAGGLQRLVMFIVPGAALHAVTAMRVAATYAFAACIGGEMIIGGRRGVGAAILELSERYELEAAYAYVLCAGGIGLLIDILLTRLARLEAVAWKR